jgi:hypothetical protein
LSHRLWPLINLMSVLSCLLVISLKRHYTAVFRLGLNQLAIHSPLGVWTHTFGLHRFWAQTMHHFFLPCTHGFAPVGSYALLYMILLLVHRSGYMHSVRLHPLNLLSLLFLSLSRGAAVVPLRSLLVHIWHREIDLEILSGSYSWIVWVCSWLPSSVLASFAEISCFSIP